MNPSSTDHLAEITDSTPAEPREDGLAFAGSPIFDELRDQLCDPQAEHYFYLDADDVERDAFDREEPEPWFPNDLRSMAALIAARMGTTYTGFTREHAEALKRELAPEPTSVTEWITIHRPSALTAPTLVGGIDEAAEEH